MASTSKTIESVDDALLSDDYFIDPAEGRRQFDALVRSRLGMSGDEFIRKFDAGEYATIPDDEAHREIINLAILIPFGR